jgi:cysteine desulfurase/selenocysteine lyase
MEKVRKDFSIFKTYPKMVYLDSAATSQKPLQVIKAVSDWYTKHNSNVHRGMYDLSVEATQVYEEARDKVAKFIGAKDSKEVIFTGNATEAINLVAWGWGKKFLRKGDIVVLSEMEHHSNIVPWMRLRDEIEIEIYFLRINEKYELDWSEMDKLLKNKIRLVAITGASNVLGTVNPIGQIIKWLIANKIKAKLLVDGAQLVPHVQVNVQKMGIDFLAFSGHKMLGPSGIGVLWARRELLEEMDPLIVGSHMINEVTSDKITWADLPDRFEAGTGRLEAVAGLGAAIDYLNKIGWKEIIEKEKLLNGYMVKLLKNIDGLKIYGKKDVRGRLGVWSFNIDGVHAHDVAEVLNRRHVCVRAGHHCAQPLMKVLGVPATVRASLYIYNDKNDIDRLIEGIMEVKKIFKK